MSLNLSTHRVLKADFALNGQLEFPIEIPFLRCALELERLVGTSEQPGTDNGIVSSTHFPAYTTLDPYA
jgi:hypothetical protein